MLSCYACPVHCRHRYDIQEGRFSGTKGEGPEYGSIGSLGPKLGILDLDASSLWSFPITMLNTIS
jgi:aldehyde:ferredoxin oxidoreductase